MYKLKPASSVFKQNKIGAKIVADVQVFSVIWN